MKKLFTLFAIFALTTSFTYAVTFGDNLKNSIKSDISKTKSDFKSAVKADMENAAKANNSAAAAKKQQKIKEIDAKLKSLNSELAQIKKDKSITETERMLKSSRVQRQINYYQKQRDALK